MKVIISTLLRRLRRRDPDATRTRAFLSNSLLLSPCASQKIAFNLHYFNLRLLGPTRIYAYLRNTYSRFKAIEDSELRMLPLDKLKQHAQVILAVGYFFYVLYVNTYETKDDLYENFLFDPTVTITLIPSSFLAFAIFLIYLTESPSR